MTTTTCRACDAEIVFAETRNGKRMPVDVEPNPDGNCYLSKDGTDATVQVLAGDDLAEAKRSGLQLHKSHFTTCPESADFRRRDRKVAWKA